MSETQLERLRTQLLPFGSEWTASTGRLLATVRDGLDFLAAMKQREDFWVTLTHAETLEPSPIDFRGLREALLAAPLHPQENTPARLQSLGLSMAEAETLLRGLTEPEGVDEAIREAFSAASPQEVAQALEHILDTDPDILATHRCLRRFAEFSRVPRGLSAMLGISLLLLGTACNPSAAAAPKAASPLPAASSARAPEPAPTSPTPAPEPTPVPSPTPDPAPASNAFDVLESEPETETEPTANPAPTQRNQKRPVRPPTVRYKGVSPRFSTAGATPTKFSV